MANIFKAFGVLVLLWISGPTQSAQNLVFNGDFSTGNLAGWKATPYWSWGVADFGDGFIAVGGNSHNPGIELIQQLSLTPGSTYRLDFNAGGGFGWRPTLLGVSLGTFSTQFGIGTGSGPNAPNDYSYNYTAINHVESLKFFNTCYGCDSVFLDNVTVTKINSSPTPTMNDLANLSIAVYAGGNDTRFRLIAESVDDTSHGFKAQAFEDGNQIVIAIRGTNRSAASFLKDIAADRSFITGAPSEALRLYTAQAAAFLKSVHDAHPTSNITLTGHSLGGALAEMLGDASNYQTVVFNSPGAVELGSRLAETLEPVRGLSGNAEASVQVIRRWGDQISLAGVENPDRVWTLAPDADAALKLQTISGVLDLHSIDTLGSRLDGAIQLQTGQVGSKYDYNILNFGVEPRLPGGFGLLAQIADLLTIYHFDPPPAGGYEFVTGAGSPFLNRLMLARYSDIDHYRVSALIDGVWGEEAQVDPLEWFSFADSSSGFSVRAFKENGSQMNFNDALLFDLTFKSTGELSANLNMLPTVAEPVPEPAEWAMILAGLAIVSRAARRRASVLKAPRA